MGQACRASCEQCPFTVICSNGVNTWENEAHCSLDEAIKSAKAEPGSEAFLFKDGKHEPIGKVTAAWVEDTFSGRMVWPN